MGRKLDGTVIKEVISELKGMAPSFPMIEKPVRLRPARGGSPLPEIDYGCMLLLDSGSRSEVF